MLANHRQRTEELVTFGRQAASPRLSGRKNPGNLQRDREAPLIARTHVLKVACLYRGTSFGSIQSTLMLCKCQSGPLPLVLRLTLRVWGVPMEAPSKVTLFVCPRLKSPGGVASIRVPTSPLVPFSEK